MSAVADTWSAEQDLADARDALGRRLGQIINALADRDDVLLEMVWDEREGADPAWFVPALAQVTVNGAIAVGDTHPDDVDPLSEPGRLRHPVVVGVCGHEAAHARSTRWQEWDAEVGRAVIRAAVLLEEPRIEARHLAVRPGDRVFLRASARHIVLPKPGGEQRTAERWHAATAVALVLMRAAGGVLDAQEVREVRDLAVRSLGAADTEALCRLGREALYLADGDQAGLVSVARRWVAVVGADEDDDLPGAGCAGQERAGSTGDGDGQGQGDRDGGSGSALAAAVAALVEEVSVQAQVSTGAIADPKAEQQARQEGEQRAQAKAAEAAARADAVRAAQQVFAPAPSGRPVRERNPISNWRAPTSDERAVARRLGKALAKARFRDPVMVRRSSAVPPGRVSGRDAMLGAAQQAMGLPVTAQPFRQRLRLPSTEPPISVGVLVDVSGSMKPYTGVIASTAWAFAQAAAFVGGQAASCAFGASVTAIVRPGRAPRTVAEFSANDGRHRFREAAAAADGALNLATGTGARLLAIVSDGIWEPEERNGGERMVKRLLASGVHVVWICLDPQARPLPGVERLNVRTVGDIPDALGAALVSALREA